MILSRLFFFCYMFTLFYVEVILGFCTTSTIGLRSKLKNFHDSYSILKHDSTGNTLYAIRNNNHQFNIHVGVSASFLFSSNNESNGTESLKTTINNETKIKDDKTDISILLSNNSKLDKAMNETPSIKRPKEKNKKSTFQNIFTFLAKIDDPDILTITLSLFVGLFSGLAVALFKVAVEGSSEIFYGPYSSYIPHFLIPVVGGLCVSIFMILSEFSPGLRGTANEIDSLTIQSTTKKDNWIDFFSKFIIKSLASITTLGSGNSLGPEGPSVEVGMAMTRTVMFLSPFEKKGEDILSKIRRNRLLLSAGAAAGVSAGFNAPLTGIFFALEVIQPALPPIKLPSSSSSSYMSSDQQQRDLESQQPCQPQNIIIQQDLQSSLSSGSGFIAPIVLASVLSALVSHIFLGNTLVLKLPPYNLKEPLVELPLYLLLGVISGIVANIFATTAQSSKAFFDGELGPDQIQTYMKSLPVWIKPSLGALACSLIGVVYPQVLFFGYVTLNTLLGPKSYVDTSTMLQLLGAKIFSTAICAGSGLVGGTFAPSLFLGGMAGASFHNIVESIFGLIENYTMSSGSLNSDYTIVGSTILQLADRQAYAMVGAASVLAALFRAPLTASLLLFELTRDYDVILPLLASAGVGGLVGDFLEKLLVETRRDRDSVSWGDLADDDDDDNN